MNNKELGRALKQLKNLPLAGSLDQEFVSRNKEILLMQIKNTSSEKKEALSIRNAWGFFESIIPDTAFRYIVRPVVTGVMIFGIVFGGWAATVSASYNSLPGDKLYSLKIMAEQAQLSLTSKENKPSLQVEFVGRRVEEIAKIAEKTSIEDKGERTIKAVEVINKQLNDVKTSLDSLDTKTNNKAVEVAKLVDRKTTEFSSALSKTKDTLPETVHGAVDSASDLADDTSIKALAVIVKNNDGDIKLNDADVKSSVESKLKIVEDRVIRIDASTAVTKENNKDENTVNKDTSVEEEISQGAKEALGKAQDALDIEDLDDAVAKIVEAKNIVNGVVIDDNILGATSTPSVASTSTQATIK